MSFYNTKGSHLAELIHELTTLELDKSEYARNGNKLTGIAVRASRYDRKTDQGKLYDQQICNLYEQALTELSFLTEEEARGILKRFDVIQLKHDKAFSIIEQYQDLYRNDKFNVKDFENEFNQLFNLPQHSQKYDNSIITINLFYDLFDAVSSKEWALHQIKRDFMFQYFPNELKLGTDTVRRYPEPEVFIKETTQRKVISELVPFVKGRVDDLERLVRGEEINDPILLTCNQAEVCKIFKKIRQNDSTVKNIETAEWIYSNFRRIPKPPETDRFSKKTIIRNIGLSK